MIAGPDRRLEPPTPAAVEELVAWRPDHGVVSVYIDVDPGDRGGGWRIGVRDGLDRAVAAAAEGDRETRLAVAATARRILDELATEPADDRPRGLIGFAEASREPGEERWYGAQLPPRRTQARYAPRAHLAPLIALLDDGAALGVVAVSAERIRLFDWRLGRTVEVGDWELELASDDWRERRSPRSRDPAAAQLVSSSGRDQHEQRLESNRERFARRTGELVGARARERGWREVLMFGDERYAGPLAGGFPGDGPRHVDSADLVPMPTGRVSARIAELMPALNRAREDALLARIAEAAFAEARSAFGEQETLQALEQGRVEHLLYDAELDGPELERMVALAFSTGAAITPVEGESADRLAAREGFAALLRY